MKATVLSILAFNLAVFAFATVLFLAKAPVGRESWLDLPACAAGWWIVLGLPVSSAASAAILLSPSRRRTGMGKIGVGLAGSLLILWGLAVLLIFTATGESHDPRMDAGAATPSEGEGREER